MLSGGRCRPLRGWILAYGTAFLVLLGLFITHPPGQFTRGGIPHGDGAVERAATVGWAWVAVSRAGVQPKLPEILREL